ncbi:MAG: CBS domain-containing protein [Melioribacteraceae bacterium]|nr:CBS domain-containing protein [Melioribacteraceae bacterium]
METIKQIINSKSLFVIKSGTTIKETVNFLAEKNIGLVPVIDDTGKLLGVFSERDLVKRVIAKNLDLELTKVDEVMTKDLILAKVDESPQECLTKMKNNKIRHVLVIDEEKLVGIVSIKDLLEVNLQDMKETIEVLHNYIYAR